MECFSEQSPSNSKNLKNNGPIISLGMYLLEFIRLFKTFFFYFLRTEPQTQELLSKNAIK